MSERSSDSSDLSLSCLFSSVESDQLEVSELDYAPEMIEPYQFELVASESDSNTVPDMDIVVIQMMKRGLHSWNWWKIPCVIYL